MKTTVALEKLGHNVMSDSRMVETMKYVLKSGHERVVLTHKQKLMGDLLRNMLDNLDNAAASMATEIKEELQNAFEMNVNDALLTLKEELSKKNVKMVE